MLPKILDEIAFRDEILSKNSDIPLLSKKMEILNKWIGADFEPYRQRQSGPFQGSFLFLSWILIFFSQIRKTLGYLNIRFLMLVNLRMCVISIFYILII